NSIVTAGGRLTGTIDSVSVEFLGDTSTMMVLPASGTYTLTFTATGGGATIEVALGTGVQTTALTRYRDAAIPAGATATLVFGPGGVSTLTYKSGGTTQTVQPNAKLTGADLNLSPPSVSASADFSSGKGFVTLEASSPVGISQLWYSL